MHMTALNNCQLFFDNYSDELRKSGQPVRVLEVGSLDLNGSIRQCCPKDFEYIGADMVAGNGVDLVLEDPYVLPFKDESVDVVLSSSCFEHSEMFWLVFLETLRVLKPHGLFYLNAPSNGKFHRHPVDCWRFYPDCGAALVTWAKRNGLRPALLESYLSLQIGAPWNDFVAIFIKNEQRASMFPRRVIHTKKDFTNGLLWGETEFKNRTVRSEDMEKMRHIKLIIEDKLKIKGVPSDQENSDILE
jgi:SAM-dependent methyltransferase